MTTKKTRNSNPNPMRLILRGVEPGEQPPDIEVIVYDRGRQILATEKVKKERWLAGIIA